MTPLELKDLFRREVRDEAEPYLWTDADILTYINEAQNMFCRLAGGIADAASTDIIRVLVGAGMLIVAISPKILKLRDVRRASDGRNVDILNLEDLGTAGVTYGGYGQQWGTGGAKVGTELGPTRAVVLGAQEDAIMLIPLPAEEDVLYLVVDRLPINHVDYATHGLEIGDIHHRSLLYWMKHLAHEKQDAETYDRGRSEEFRQKFVEYCDLAKAERDRRNHKFRTVAYGGI